MIGFRAVSDDDFARVVLAQTWARTPTLDPTGSSWLPFPFWLNGLVFRLLGPSLDTARGVAFVLGLVSVWLVFAAANRITHDRQAACVGALAAAVFPWSAHLGVATIPELPTAALTLFAIATLTSASSTTRVYGALALLPATLSRYEPWPVAVAFSIFSLFSVVRLGQGKAAQVKLVVAALLALVGPVVWMIWNHVAHGDALHFLARVAAYRNALNGGQDGSVFRLLSYPIAMFREEPELVLSPFLLVFLARRKGEGAALLHAIRPYLLPMAVVSFQILLLSVAMVRDGGPTHHPERATLVMLLLLALVTGDLGLRYFRTTTAHDRRILLLVFAGLLVGGGVIRTIFPGDQFYHRKQEVGIGRIAASTVPIGTPVLIEVDDYGYHAILAGFGRPDIILDRSIDPRMGSMASSFDDTESLKQRLLETGASYVIARQQPVIKTVLGQPLAMVGQWGIWKSL